MRRALLQFIATWPLHEHNKAPRHHGLAAATNKQAGPAGVAVCTVFWQPLLLAIEDACLQLARSANAWKPARHERNILCRQIPNADQCLDGLLGFRGCSRCGPVLLCGHLVASGNGCEGEHISEHRHSTLVPPISGGPGHLGNSMDTTWRGIEGSATPRWVASWSTS